MATLLAPNAPAAKPDRRASLEDNLSRLAVLGPDAINDRLAEVEQEWSTGRVAKAVASGVVMAGLVLTVFASTWFVLLSAVGAAMLAWYAAGRRSLLMSACHACGFRSSTEIHEEILALKTLRGDFRHLPTVYEIEDRDALDRLEGEGGIVYEPEDAKAGPREAAQSIVSAARIDTASIH